MQWFCKSTWTVLTILLLVCAGQGELAVAREWGLNPFYAVSHNQNSPVSTIWQIDVTNHKAQPVYTLNAANAPLIKDVFPPEEFAVMTAEVQARNIPVDALTEPAIGKIEAVWALDATHVLAQIDVHICYHTSMAFCYGYYEFSLVDTGKQSAISLLKVTYHNHKWEGCSPGLLASVSDVSPNPKYTAFLFLLRPQGRCYERGSNRIGGTLVIIDYATQPVRQTQLPLVDRPSWSPDGTRIVYHTPYVCNDTETCSTVIKTYTPATDMTSIVALKTRIPERLSVLPLWLGNHTLLYQAYIAPTNFNDDGTPLFVSHDLNNNTERTTVVEHTSGIYGVILQDKVLIGDSYDTFVAFSADAPQRILKTFQPASELITNSRYPDAVLVTKREYDLRQLLAIASDLTEITVDLTPLIPSVETLKSVSPTGITRVLSATTRP